MGDHAIALVLHICPAKGSAGGVPARCAWRHPGAQNPDSARVRADIHRSLLSAAPQGGAHPISHSLRASSHHTTAWIAFISPVPSQVAAVLAHHGQLPHCQQCVHLFTGMKFFIAQH